MNKYKKASFTFVDLFAGIGGFRIPMESLGGKSLGFSEINKKAIEVYRNNFLMKNEDELDLGSVSDIDTFPFSVDLIAGGVPCQSWSIAGKLGGFEDPRGKLWFDSIRIVKKNQPKVFIFENVRGLLHPRNKDSFDYLIETLSDAGDGGYHVYHSLLNSYDFGLPQNRDRVFIVGIRKELNGADKFIFPHPVKYKPKLHEFIDGIASYELKKQKFTESDLFGDRVPVGRNRFQKKDEFNDFFVLSDVRNGHSTIHSWDLIETSPKEKKICMTILRNRRKKIYGLRDGNPMKFTDIQSLMPDLNENELDNLVSKSILRKDKENGYEFVNSKISAGINNVYRVYMPFSDVFSTLTATGTKDMVAVEAINAKNVDEYKAEFINRILRNKLYRPITVDETRKLQGFPEWFIPHRNDAVAKTQFGNAVPVPVVFYVVDSILRTGVFGDLSNNDFVNEEKIDDFGYADCQ